MTEAVKDCRGTPVTVGSLVRVLSIPTWLFERIPPEEHADLRSMLGEVFEVYELDEWGGAWVEKWWNGPGESHGHSLSLAAEEMEVVDVSPDGTPSA